jgi:hypothetical protein
MTKANALNQQVTQYNTLVGDAGNQIANVAPGNAGQVLTSNGVSLAPTYQSIASAGLVLLQSKTATTSATIDFTSLISTTYKNYKVVISNVFMSNQNRLGMLVSTDNGATWVNSGYQFGYINAPSTTGLFTGAGGGAQSEFFLTNNIEMSNTQPTTSFELNIFIGDASNDTTYYGNGLMNIASTGTYYLLNSGYIGAGVVNAIRFFAEAGNIQQGYFSLYGYSF